MENIEELLPGIEEFLSETLASEKLSAFAEQRRLFFLERLDIVKLPPTVPPREGRNLPQELLKDTEEKSGVPSCQNTKHQHPDFAATQREIARSWAGSSGHMTEERNSMGDGDDDSLEKVKVYDDIDTDISTRDECDNRKSIDNPYDDEEVEAHIRNGPSCNNINHLKDDDDADDVEEENDYEIPVAMQQYPDEIGDGSYPSITTAESTEELIDDVLESPGAMLPPPVPPPLPPRRDIRFSDSGSRSSINGLTDEAPPDLPYRPPLPRRSEMCGRSERSDRSDPDLSGDGDSTSYESFDEDEEVNTKNKSNNTNAEVKLPTKPLKKKTALKMSKKMSKSRSLSQWEISAPFRKLDNLVLSGELMHKGKLTWNRRIVAITNGCLVMYKPDKDGRPLMVIPLMDYEATVNERKEGRRGFEIKMTHPQDDTHLFSVDVKDWAYTWKEHINRLSKGRRSSTRPHIHLSRTLSNDLANAPSTTAALTQSNSNNNNNNNSNNNNSGGTHGSRTDLNSSTSNLSTGSEGGGTEETVRPRMRTGSRVMRMGSFAFRASQFFENISKKTSVKRKLSTQSFRGESSDKPRGSSADYQDYSCNNNHSNILEESSISSNSTGNLHHSSFNTPTSDLSIPVFSDSNSNPSVPNSPLEIPALGQEVFTEGKEETLTRNGEIGTTNVQNFQDVAHKGFLFIFSTFNRRRWGKRWCLVRGNSFECYRSENQPATQCELSFLLKACALRRAVGETGSELGLMLVEQDKGKERITVEPVSSNEMPAWVQVFMAETSTTSVPEGLEDFMKPIIKRRSSDAPSLLSLSVLKQWDMDITLQSLSSSKDSSSPEDGTAPWLISSDRISPQISAEEGITDQTVCNVEEVFPTFVKEPGPPPAVDTLAAHVKKKHTTDSGFYSVKGNNSDSDGEHVDILGITVAAKEGKEEEGEKEDVNEGCSIIESHSPHHSKQSFKNTISHQSNKSDEASIADSNPSNPVSSETLLSKPCTDNPDECSSIVPTPCTTESLTSSSLSSPFVSQSSNPPPSSNSLSFQNVLNSSCDQNTSQQSDTVIEANEPKDEYTLVLKRALRPKSNTPENGVSTDPYNTQIDNHTREPSNNQNSHSSEVMTFGSVFLDEDHQEDEVPKVPTESIYEDVEPCVDNLAIGSSLTAELDKNTSHPVEVDSNKSQSVMQSVEFFEKCNQSTDAKKSNTSLPTDSSDCDCDEDFLISDDLGSENQVEGTNPDELLPTASDILISDGRQPCDDILIPTKPPSITPISITCISFQDSAKEDFNMNTDHSTSISPTQSPELPLVEVHKPGMNEEELKEAIEKLKQKKSQLKRKRLAVHDKRQRVSSDEERLACEKEFASLERAVENTDKDVGFLQNQLDALCGHSLEAIKVNISRKKSGSKKRKPKKKAHQGT